MPNYQAGGPNKDPGPNGGGNNSNYSYTNNYTYNYNQAKRPSPPKGAAPYHVPTWAIVAGFIIAWPLGFALLIARFCEGGVNGVNFNNKTWNGHAPGVSNPGSAPRYQQPAAAQPQAASKTAPKAAPKTPKAAQKPKDKAKILPAVLTALGVFTLFVGGVNLMDVLTYALPYGVDASGASELISAGGWLLSGAGMLFGAARLRLGERIRSKIRNIVGKADNMPIAEVAEALPASAKKTEKYLQQCIDRGNFGPEAYLDMRSDSLVVRGPAPEAEKEEKPVEKPAEKPLNTNKYDAILRQLHAVNEAIPGEQMTAKIDRLENVTAKIFKLVQENPDKLPQMRKFMDYYLPTSLKLLNNYAQLDAQGVEGENIRESKRQIESTMDTLVSAFEKQLDKLFYMDSIDISADITTMQNMMAADGLTRGVFEMPDPPEAPGTPKL